MTLHIFLAPPANDCTLRQCTVGSDQIVYLYRDPTPWSTTSCKSKKTSHSSHIVFASDLFDEFLTLVGELQRNTWIQLGSTGLEANKHLLWLLHSHLIRFLDAACLLMACSKRSESTHFYLDKDNIAESPTATGLSDLAILSIATRHICDLGLGSREHFRFMLMNDNSPCLDHSVERSSLNDLSPSVYDKSIHIPALRIEALPSQSCVTDIYDLTHVRTPLQALRANNITSATNSALLINKQCGIWGDVSQVFADSCDGIFYDVASQSQPDHTNSLMSDARFSDLCVKLQCNSSPGLSVLQKSVIERLPEIILPLYTSLENSVQWVADWIIKANKTSDRIRLHVSDSNYIIKEAFARILGEKLHLTLYPHSFTTCSYQSSIESGSVRILTNCPFPAGLRTSWSPRGVSLEVSYPNHSAASIIPNRLMTIMKTWNKLTKTSRCINGPISVGIFLGSEIEGMQLISNPLATRDYIYAFCDLCNKLSISAIMNIYPKTIFQSQDLMNELYAENLNGYNIKVHWPSHAGIQLESIGNLDCHLFWGHGSANIEAALMAIPALCINSFHQKIHLCDFNYTGYDIIPINIEPTMPACQVKSILSKASLKGEGLAQQAGVLFKLHQSLHGF